MRVRGKLFNLTGVNRMNEKEVNDSFRGKSPGEKLGVGVCSLSLHPPGKQNPLQTEKVLKPNQLALISLVPLPTPSLSDCQV